MGSDRMAGAGPVAGDRPVLRLPSLAGDLVALTKPRITGLVLATAAAGYTAAAGGVGELVVLAHLLVATLLLSGGTNALNQYLEREADGRMARTRSRPLPAGRLRPALASGFGVSMVVAGTLYLLIAVNPLTAGLGLASAALYVGVYTPLKRRSWTSLLVGAVPGALPILGGWTAHTAALDPVGVALFGVVFLWQLPHFLALGWIYREEYARAGFVILPTRPRGRRRSRTYAALSALALLPVSFLPTLMGTAGWAYAAVAAGVGIHYVTAAARFTVRGDEDSASGLFRASLLYLPVLLLALALDVIVGTAGLSGPDLPTVNAALNSLGAVGLAVGYLAIRKGKLDIHRGAMLTAAAASAVFLASYLVYHVTVGSVAFAGTGWTRWVYFPVLISHAILAAVVLPLAVMTVVRGLDDRRDAHRRIARWVFPPWMYVSVTGLLVYLMLYHWW